MITAGRCPSSDCTGNSRIPAPAFLPYDAAHCGGAVRGGTPNSLITRMYARTFTWRHRGKRLHDVAHDEHNCISTSCSNWDSDCGQDLTYDFLAIWLATLLCSTPLQALAKVFLFSGPSLTFSNHLSRTENILSLGVRGGWVWPSSVQTCVLWWRRKQRLRALSGLISSTISTNSFLVRSSWTKSHSLSSSAAMSIACDVIMLL